MRPSHISLIIWFIFAIMVALCILVPSTGFTFHGYTLRWPMLTEVIGHDALTDSLSHSTHDTTALANTPASDSALVTVDSLMTDSSASASDAFRGETRVYLSRFYASLDATDSTSVRIVHYGDSQIEEDRITRSLRQCLQDRYGGGGVGLIPLHQTIPSATIRQRCYIRSERQATSAGPRRYLVYGIKRMRGFDNFYGPMGQVALLADSCVAGSDTISINVTPFGSSESHAHYFNRVRLFADSVSGYVTLGKHSIPLSPNRLAVLPDSTQRCGMTLIGPGRVYGISLETPTGIHVDNIPMRGCSGLILTNINKRQLTNYFAATNTRLVIMQYGGNWMPYAKKQENIDRYVESMHTQVNYIRRCAPNADILFIGPSDMSTLVDGTLTTYPLLPAMDDALRRMAIEEHIAYWSMYHAMGGRNSMIRFHELGLAGNDYVHFTSRGADKIGELLSHWLLEPIAGDSAAPVIIDSTAPVPADSVSSVSVDSIVQRQLK